MVRRLALDTNLLILLVVGQVSRRLISEHRRIRSYSEGDYELLTETLSKFHRLIVTPNSATETSNLINDGWRDPYRSRLRAVLGAVLAGSDEHYEPSASICLTPEFRRLGLTDAVWLKVLGSQSVLLTDDGELYAAALQNDIRAYKFSHVRQLRALK
jgi:hypothetical protein